jgi:uncharacterized membrane protein
MATPCMAAGLIGATTKTELFLTILALAAALLVAAVIIKLVDRWRKQPDADALSSKDQLAHFQRLHWRGELSKEEFERIQSLLGERVRREEAPANPAAPPERREPSDKPPEPPQTGIRPQPPG